MCCPHKVPSLSLSLSRISYFHSIPFIFFTFIFSLYRITPSLHLMIICLCLPFLFSLEYVYFSILFLMIGGFPLYGIFSSSFSHYMVMCTHPISHIVPLHFTITSLPPSSNIFASRLHFHSSCRILCHLFHLFNLLFSNPSRQCSPYIVNFSHLNMRLSDNRPI